LGGASRSSRAGKGSTASPRWKANEQLAAACLTTAFIFSQREAAVRWLVPANDEVRLRFLPALARGDRFVTVGLSQLTTSRQHRPPSLRARAVGGTAYRLDGDIPWVTGADRADGIVAGAVLEDGRQILLLLPSGPPGLEIAPPMRLAALTGSRTAQVRCDGVEVPPA